MSSVSAPSPAAPVAAESQAGPALQLAEAGGRGRPWLRLTSSTGPRLWLCVAVAVALAFALGTIVSAGASANPVWPLCFGLIVVTLLAGRGRFRCLGASWDFGNVIAERGIRRTSLLSVAILRLGSQALLCPPRWAAYCGALGR